MMVLRATGSWALNRSWAGEAPNATIASTISVGTWRMPRLVKRITGGMAKMIVTITPGTLPMPPSTAAVKARSPAVKPMMKLVKL